MTDYFALLNEPRRPWLDAGSLKDKFMELSTHFHPDKFPHVSPEEKERISNRYVELNAAFQCLSNPRERVLHLIELETGKKPSDVQRIPPGSGDLFMEVGQTCSQVAKFLETKSPDESPMLKAKRFVEQVDWVDRLTLLQGKIGSIRERLEEELKQMNTELDQGGKLPLERLEEIYRSLSYVGRWSEQMREKLVLLAL